ncbi:MAG: metallophosphoesterase [Lentisphaeria bacterium]|nr:metallophosphoesterase [Lentisphaeria bacterium]
MYHNKPFISVRGNHELRGRECGRWFGLLGPDGNKAYYSFRYGKACIVVLDSGGGVTDRQRNTLSAAAMKEYMRQQRHWVETLVNSPEYANADYRIVIAHFSPHACNPVSTEMLKYTAEPLFKASSDNSRRIHLYIGAHIHKYRRSIPGTTSVYANANVVQGEVADGKKYNFPIMIMDGPGKNIGFDLSASVVKVTPQYLEVKSFDDKSRCFDHFTVDKQGNIREIDNPYKKSILKLYNF